MSAPFNGVMSGMRVIQNRSLPSYALPGIEHRTLARHIDGLERLEVWMQTLEPGAATQIHYHECEKVVLAFMGGVRVVGDGEELVLEAGSTLVIPSRQLHQLVNAGSVPAWIVAVLSETPARSFKQDGQPIAIPWQAWLPTGTAEPGELISLHPVWISGEEPAGP